MPPEERPSEQHGASTVLALLRDGHPRRKADLVASTGWARATVSARLDELVGTGIIRLMSNVRTAGRPSSSYALDPHGRIVLGAQIGAYEQTVGLIDLLGRPILSRSVRIPIEKDPAETLRRVVEVADELLMEAGKSRADLLAVGLGVPGPVDNATSLPVGSTAMAGWEHFEVSAWLSAELQVPTFIDNLVNLEALAERAESWSDVEDILFVRVGAGVGAAIISDGVIHRGAQGAAGDIGHMRLRQSDAPCLCGGRGCLAASVSGPALVAALKEQGLQVDAVDDVISLASEGSLVAIDHLRAAGQALGEVLASCVSLLNPAVIVIGGPLIKAGDHFLAGARETIYAASMPFAARTLQVVYSNLDALGSVRGAGMLALDHILSSQYLPSIRPLPSGLRESVLAPR